MSFWDNWSDGKKWCMSIASALVIALVIYLVKSVVTGPWLTSGHKRPSETKKIGDIIVTGTFIRIERISVKNKEHKIVMKMTPDRHNKSKQRVTWEFVPEPGFELYGKPIHVKCTGGTLRCSAGSSFLEYKNPRIINNVGYLDVFSKSKPAELWLGWPQKKLINKEYSEEISKISVYSNREIVLSRPSKSIEAYAIFYQDEKVSTEFKLGQDSPNGILKYVNQRKYGDEIRYSYELTEIKPI